MYSTNAAKRRKVRDMVLAEIATEDGDEKPDLTAWAPSRDAIKPLNTAELTEEQKEFITWHAARREANMRARGRLKDVGGEELPSEEKKGDRSFFHGKVRMCNWL